MGTEEKHASTFALTRFQTNAAAVAAVVIVLVFQDTLGFLYDSWRREEYSHGFLIPLITAFLLWQRWPEIRHRQFQATWAGIPVMVVALVGGVIGLMGGNATLAALAMVVAIGGSMLALLGWNAFRMALGPVALLFLMIPLPDGLYQILSSKLQFLSAHLGVAVIRLLGSSVFLENNVIDLGIRRLQVTGTYSGLNYLLPLLTLAVIMAFYMKSVFWKRCVLVLSAIPLTVITSGLRLGITGVLVDRYGADPSSGLLAGLEGWAVFMICAALLVAEVWLLLRVSGDRRQVSDVIAIEWGRIDPAGDNGNVRAHGKRARLLIVTSNFAPELTGIGKYVGDMSAWMSEAGFEIRVVTSPPYYPAWRVPPGYSSRRYARERLSGALVYRCPLLVPRRPRGLTRLLHTLSFSLSTLPVILWQAIGWRPQIVMVVEPPLGCAPAALLAATLCGARSWLHIQDFEVDAAFDLGLLRGERLRRLAVGAERWLMRRFDRVSSISPRMIRKLLRKGVERARIEYFPNWVDTSLIRPVARDNSLRRELEIPAEASVFLYSGNMGEKQGLELLVEVAKLFAAAGSSALFLLCGDGAAKPRAMAAATGLGNVRFVPLQPLSRLNELLGLADVHMLPQRKDAEDLVMPSKLTAILASGRPVVASARVGSDLARAASAGGLVTPPGDPVSFAAALERLLDDVELRAALGRSGRNYAVANWDRDTILRNAERELDSVLGERLWNKTDTSYG